MERDPVPDVAAWRQIENPSERLRAGLAGIYGWYGRNAELAACVYRDLEIHPLVREVNELRMGPFRAACREVLGEKLNADQRAMLPLALSYYTWRSLVRDAGLKQAAAVDAMVKAVIGAKQD